MIGIIKRIFRTGSEVDFKELVNKGAQIIDVRTKEEYRNGHIKGSVNIPLRDLSHNISKIRKNAPIITCCASGVRSASAKSILKSHGFVEVHNGRGWTSLKRKIRN